MTLTIQRRYLGLLAIVATLVIGMAGCAQTDLYGTVDTGVGYNRTSK